MCIFIELCMRGDLLFLLALKGNNTCEIYDFRIKIGNVQMGYLRNKSWKPECVGSFNMDWRILLFYPESEARDTIY